MSLADAVKNGPRVANARAAHIEARIRLVEAKGKAAHDKAAGLRRRASGDGPLAKSRKLRASALEASADRRRAKANQLRADLAKTKAEEAARHAKHVKRTVASTAASGLKPKAAGQGGRPNRAAQAKSGQPTSRPRPTSGGSWQDPPATGTVCDKVDPRCTYCGQRTSKPVTNWRGEVACPKHVKFLPEEPKPWTPPANRCTATSKREFDKVFKTHTGLLEAGGRELRTVRCPNEADPDGLCDTHRTTTTKAASAPTKGTPAMTVSGEAVNIEQTRSNLDQLKGQVADLRGSFEGISGSLASGGLNQLAGSLASADDALDSVTTQITAAEKHLSDQEAIAEAAQAAGEMHTDTSFYA